MSQLSLCFPVTSVFFLKVKVACSIPEKKLSAPSLHTPLCPTCQQLLQLVGFLHLIRVLSVSLVAGPVPQPLQSLSSTPSSFKGSTGDHLIRTVEQRGALIYIHKDFRKSGLIPSLPSALPLCFRNSETPVRVIVDLNVHVEHFLSTQVMPDSIVRPGNAVLSEAKKVPAFVVLTLLRVVIKQ